MITSQRKNHKISVLTLFEMSESCFWKCPIESQKPSLVKCPIILVQQLSFQDLHCHASTQHKFGQIHLLIYKQRFPSEIMVIDCPLYKNYCSSLNHEVIKITHKHPILSHRFRKDSIQRALSELWPQLIQMEETNWKLNRVVVGQPFILTKAIFPLTRWHTSAVHGRVSWSTWKMGDEIPGSCPGWYFRFEGGTPECFSWYGCFRKWWYPNMDGL